ncbi:MAG TPA: hypothetical protein VJ790_03225 [Dongiaceae bacterium]|nr:hypothetical protein [Dongiaceae bacterium]
MPTKKKSCECVHQAIAGPAPDQILEAIRAEYWLPVSPPQPASREPSEDTPDQAIKPKTQVKP